MYIKVVGKLILKQFNDVKTYGIKELFRKLKLLLKKLVKIPIYLIALIPFLIIRLISPLIVIRIEKAPSSNFGAFAGELAVYCLKKKFKINQPQKKYVDLLYITPSDKIYNKQLAKMWKRTLKFFPGYLLEPIDVVNRFFPGWKKHTIEILYSKVERDIDNLIEKCQLLNFTSDEEAYGKETLKKIGLNDDDKFVCLAVRDEAYQLKKIPSRFKDWSYHSHRNYNIDDFVLAAESLAERGYYVFRMGVVVEKHFTSNNPKIIDYANSEFRSDFMDMYLAAKCSFCVSTCVGFFESTYIFKKPIALIHLPLGDFPSHSDKYLLMTKHHILKKEKRKLSLSEIFSHGVAFAYDSKIFREKGIELVPCTSEEIKDFVVEMAENLEFKKKLSSEDEVLQKRFQNLFASNIQRFNHRPDGKNVLLYSNGNEVIFRLHGKIRSRFSLKFLRENKNWLR